MALGYRDLMNPRTKQCWKGAARSWTAALWKTVSFHCSSSAPINLDSLGPLTGPVRCTVIMIAIPLNKIHKNLFRNKLLKTNKSSEINPVRIHIVKTIVKINPNMAWTICVPSSSRASNLQPFLLQNVGNLLFSCNGLCVNCSWHVPSSQKHVMK